MSAPDLVGFFKAVYPDGSWPSPFHILEGLERLAKGESLKEAAKAVRTLPSVLAKLQGDPEAAYKIIGVRPGDLTEEDVRKAATI